MGSLLSLVSLPGMRKEQTHDITNCCSSSCAASVNMKATPNFEINMPEPAKLSNMARLCKVLGSAVLSSRASSDQRLEAGQDEHAP